ncbi:MAG: hypothetical protein HZB16_18120 [Armatimonadetes bacterium]|nr:hypothetical protein [Armatimonadota bacterium]
MDVTTLWATGSCAGSLFLGGIVGNLTASLLERAAAKMLGPTLHRLRETLFAKGCLANSDLLRAVRLAECDAMVACCERCLIEDYGHRRPVLAPLVVRPQRAVRVDPALGRVLPVRAQLPPTVAGVELSAAERRHATRCGPMPHDLQCRYLHGDTHAHNA